MRRMDTVDPHLARCRDVIDRQVTQMTRLLEDLLDVSRITRSKLELRRDALDLATAIEQAVEIARSWVSTRGLPIAGKKSEGRGPLKRATR